MVKKHLSHPGSSRPLPPSLRGEDKRSVILRAAHELFLRDGFLATSMDAVTREAGVSKATVYAHFESKEKLFECLMRDGSEDALRSIPPLVRRGGDPATELLAFFEPLLALIFEGGYAWNRMIIAEAERHPVNARLFYGCTIERLTATVEQYLGELARENVIEGSDNRPRAQALIAVAILGPLHHLLLLGPESVDYRSALRFGVETMLRTASPEVPRRPRLRKPRR